MLSLLSPIGLNRFAVEIGVLERTAGPEVRARPDPPTGKASHIF